MKITSSPMLLDFYKSWYARVTWVENRLNDGADESKGGNE